MRDKALLEGMILREQVKQLYRLAPMGFIGTVLNSFLVFLVMKEVIPVSDMTLWLAAVLTITAARGLDVCCFHRTGPDGGDSQKLHRRFTFGLFLVGVAWGSLALFPFSFPLPYQVFIAFVLGGMAAGATSTFSKVRLGYPAFALPALVPLTLHYLLINDTFHHAMALMTLLFLVLLWKISQHNYSINRTSLFLRFENQEMIENLKSAKDDVEALNRQLVEEIQAKREAEEELRAYQADLEQTVEERTAALVAANEELAAARDAAEAGSMAKSEFLANMSHEMRTPLAGALGMIRLVLDMKIGEEERQLLEMARRSSESLLRIIADVLDFSRLEAGVLKFDRRFFGVEETVKTAVEVVSYSATEKGLRLEWKVDDSVGQMEGDQGRLRQVLINLLGNAVKFTEKGGIELSVGSLSDPQAGGTFLLFTVRDTGVGIPADQLERIFGKFTQIDSSLTRRYGGTGLGLALSRQIVEKSGGRIWAESTPGAGSTFYFTLPLSPPSAPRE